MRNRLYRALRDLAWWILKRLHPSPDDVDRAVVQAFADCGLNVDLCHDTFNVRASGKIHEVLIHASDRLGNPLVTVADLKAMLR